MLCYMILRVVNLIKNMNKKIDFKKELDSSMRVINTDTLPTLRISLRKEIINRWHSLQDRYDFLCPWWRNEKWYNMKCFFFPKTKWIRNALDNGWHDLDYCYTQILFAGIINYVEGERCFETIRWTTPQEKRHKKKIEEIYTWAKTGRKELQEKIDGAYPPLTDIDGKWITKLNKMTQEECKKNYELTYGELNRLEKLLYDTDTKYMVWLISWRSHLWT